MKKLPIWLWIKAKFVKLPDFSTDNGVIAIITYDSMLKREQVSQALWKNGFKRVIVLQVPWNTRPIEFIPFEIPDYWDEKTYGQT